MEGALGGGALGGGPLHLRVRNINWISKIIYTQINLLLTLVKSTGNRLHLPQELEVDF